jgi:hypothetical protein
MKNNKLIDWTEDWEEEDKEEILTGTIYTPQIIAEVLRGRLDWNSYTQENSVYGTSTWDLVRRP